MQSRRWYSAAPAARASRRREIRDLLPMLTARLEEVQKQLAAPSPDDEPALDGYAR